MFESKINRGKANGYAPLDGSGKVPLDKLPPIQSTINTGSFATTGSNTFFGEQIVSGNLLLAGNISGALALVDNVEIFTSQINFVPNSSGDGNGLSTIEIRPDITAYADQYLIIEPTYPNHIHIRGGGEQDNSDSTFIIGGENSNFGIPNGLNPAPYITSDENIWQFNGNGSITFPDNSVQTTAFTGINLSSLATTGSNIFRGTQSISGSVNISSSLIVSSTVVNSGSINALNSDLIIDGGYLILTGSTVPVTPTGSAGDKEGMVTFDKNFLYYCTNDYIPFTASVPSTQTFSITASGATHIYDAEPGTIWNNYNNGGPSYWLQIGPSQEGDGSTPVPVAGWYFVDDSGTIREITSDNAWFGPQTPLANGTGWLCSVDAAWTYSEITNSTITLHESLPTVNPGEGTPAVEGNPGSGEIWTKTKLDKGPNYAPFGSSSFDNASTDITVLDITKDIHLIDITDIGDNSHFYLPNGLYDGQVVRFALKGNDTNGPNSVYIWMDNLRSYDGQTQSETNWSPFWDNGSNSPRSLATALYIDGAWNIDTNYWGEW